MIYSEQFAEHIEYVFRAFCKIVLCHEAMNAWRDLKRKEEREISLDCLMSEKYFEPLLFSKILIERSSAAHHLRSVTKSFAAA